MKIRVFHDKINFRLKNSRRILRLIKEIMLKENVMSADLCFIFTSDRKIRELNREFLKHDYFTDVIAFGEKLSNSIKGEIYISIDTVRKNSRRYNVTEKEEVLRVMIHAVLHLCGYKDKTAGEKSRMRELEDYWIEWEK